MSIVLSMLHYLVLKLYDTKVFRKHGPEEIKQEEVAMGCNQHFVIYYIILITIFFLSLCDLFICKWHIFLCKDCHVVQIKMPNFFYPCWYVMCSVLFWTLTTYCSIYLVPH